MAKSIYLSSDESFSYICDICVEDDKDVEGVAYCSVCEQYLCGTCKTVHERSKASISHSLLTGNKIPHHVKTDVKTPFCKTHVGQVVKYFCKDHEVPCCDKCKLIDHRVCKAVENVHSLAINRDTILENKATFGQFEDLLTEVERLKTGFDLELNALVCQKDVALQKVHEQRLKLDKVLDEWEKGLENDITSCYRKEAHVVNNNISIFKEIAPAIQAKIDQIQKALNASDEEVFLFIAASEARKEIKKYADILRQLHTETHKVEIEFYVEETSTSKSILECLNECVRLQVVKNKDRRTLPVFSVRPYRERVPLELDEIDASSATDTKTPHISGIEVLEDGLILLCDAHNRKLKLFDCNIRPLSEMTMSSEPWRISSTSTPKEVVVTLPNERAIQFIGIDSHKKITLSAKVKLNKACQFIIAYGNDFIVYYYTDLKYGIKIINRVGNFIRTVIDNQTYPKMKNVTSTVNLALSPDKQTIYITERNNGCLAFSMRGDVKFMYTDDRVNPYIGVTTDPEGNIYISGTESKNVVMVNSKGETIKVLLERIASARYASARYIKYNSSINTLFVHMNGTHIVKTYHLM